VDYSYFDLWAKTATWTIKDAAMLVCGLDPASWQDLTFEPQSTAPASRVFFWLIKEFTKGTLNKVTEEDGEPRFSPGTLVRRVRERGKFKISTRLESAMDRAESAPGPGKVNQEGVEKYQRVAGYIWADHPNISAVKMAERLETLPSFVKSEKLPSMSCATIRRYLKGLGPHRAGRPPKDQPVDEHIDLAEYAKRI
jgi:hypothetical protein